VDTLDQLGFQLEGMPTASPHADRDPPQDSDEVVAVALDDLTRVAPFLEAAVDGELRHERGRHFVYDYRRLLDDAEHGFYWVLCQLHRLRTAALAGVSEDEEGNTSRTLSSADATLPAGGTAVHSNAIRHYRDYVVLRDFGRLLDAHRLLLWRRHSRRSSRNASSAEV